MPLAAWRIKGGALSKNRFFVYLVRASEHIEGVGGSQFDRTANMKGTGLVTIRAAIIGVLLGLGIAGTWYFNDFVMNQTYLVGNLLPLSIFGLAVVLALVVNPLLSPVGKRWLFSGREIALIVVLGLGVCGWAGSGYLRYFSTNLSIPSFWLKTKPAWQSAEVMSYVPGGSFRLGEGHVRDWPGLLKQIHEASRSEQASPGKRLWEQLPTEMRRVVTEAANTGRVTPQDRQRLIRSFNEIIGQPSFYDPQTFAGVTLPDGAAALEQSDLKQLSRDEVEQFNRALLVAVFPEHIQPRPEGEGVLLLGGRSDPQVVEALIQGHAGNSVKPITEIHWSAWWPSIRLWGGFALFCGIAALCMALIVHPQWARRELLAYPVARFVDEVTQRREGGVLPEVARSKLFWIALTLILLLHLTNGIKVWFPGSFINIPLRVDFSPLQTLFPNAAKAPATYGLFYPTLYPTVVAFAFFLTTSVSLSLGLSQFVWAFMGALLVANGVSMQGGWNEANMQNMLIFGAYVGFALIIFYVGRRHYWDVAKAAVGLSRKPETPAYTVWAMRVFAVCVVGAAWLLQSVGLDWSLGLPVVGLIMLTFLVIARANAETGAIFLQANWLPMAIVTGLLGMEAVGPTAYILMTMASFMLVCDAREAIMPYLVNALEISERSCQTPPRRIVPWMALMITGGLVVGIVGTVWIQYNYGLASADTWARVNVGQMMMDKTASMVSGLSSSGMLEPAMQIQGLQRWWSAAPKGETLGWAGLGLALVITTALARLRLPWWPIHPVLFIFWGTFPANMFAISFLVGCIIKTSVVKLMGVKGYHTVKALMVGIIAGELLAAMMWMMVGLMYFANTGLLPKRYGIMPG